VKTDTAGRAPSAQPLIERIRAQEQTGKVWNLRAAEVRELLGLDSAAFYRRIYAAERAGNRLVGLAFVGERYSQENVGELVSLLELFCGREAEQQLYAAGIFLPHAEQRELMGAFLNVAAEAVRGHRLETGEFSAMLRAFGSFERARRVYREQYFPMEPLTAEAIRRYGSTRVFGIPDLALANARRILQLFFRKHLLEPEDLFAPLFERLREQAVLEGYAQQSESYGQPGGRSRTTRGAEPKVPMKPVLEARRAMGLEGRALDLTLLKSRYRELIRIYHPDINPEGLRRCQEINAAYSLLAAGLSG
jgi:hypothetical protein